MRLWVAFINVLYYEQGKHVELVPRLTVLPFPHLPLHTLNIMHSYKRFEGARQVTVHSKCGVLYQQPIHHELLGKPS